MNSPQRYVLLATALLELAGCTAMLHEAEPIYVTVEANPNRDTKLAEAENARAAKILERSAAGGPRHLEKAEKLLNKALVADVAFGPAHNNLGKIYFMQDRFYVAAWEFEYAIKVMPDRPEPHNNLAMVYEAVGKLELAREQYETAYALAGTNPEVIGNLARVRLRGGDRADDLRYLFEALVVHDTRPEWTRWAREQLAKGEAQANHREQTSDTPSATETLPPPNPKPVPEFGPSQPEGDRKPDSSLPPTPNELDVPRGKAKFSFLE